MTIEGYIALTDGGIVYTVDDHLLDSSSLEIFLFLKVSWNLCCGSGGSEGSGKSYNNDVLSGAVVGDIDCFDIRESLHDTHIREGGE